jgi:hypothetical protein
VKKSKLFRFAAAPATGLPVYVSMYKVYQHILSMPGMADVHIRLPFILIITAFIVTIYIIYYLFIFQFMSTSIGGPISQPTVTRAGALPESGIPVNNVNYDNSHVQPTTSVKHFMSMYPRLNFRDGVMDTLSAAAQADNVKEKTLEPIIRELVTIQKTVRDAVRKEKTGSTACLLSYEQGAAFAISRILGKADGNLLKTACSMVGNPTPYLAADFHKTCYPAKSCADGIVDALTTILSSPKQGEKIRDLSSRISADANNTFLNSIITHANIDVNFAPYEYGVVCAVDLLNTGEV